GGRSGGRDARWDGGAPAGKRVLRGAHQFGNRGAGDSAFAILPVHRPRAGLHQRFSRTGAALRTGPERKNTNENFLPPRLQPGRNGHGLSPKNRCRNALAGILLSSHFPAEDDAGKAMKSPGQFSPDKPPPPILIVDDEDIVLAALKET